MWQSNIKLYSSRDNLPYFPQPGQLAEARGWSRKIRGQEPYDFWPRESRSSLSFLWPSAPFHKCICTLGPRQTSDFDEQYCDKKIKRYCDKKIFFQQYFSSSCELKISIHGYFSWFWKAKAIFCKKIIALSHYRNIALSQYCSSKSLVWRGPYGDQSVS